MLPDDAPLRRLPLGLNAKQALFLDGIRHANDLMELAYSRLSATLTQLALQPPAEQLTASLTAPFLDAWGVIDAIDRLRALIRSAPGVSLAPETDGPPDYFDRTADIRSIRNVGDHLAQRADYVIACNSTALGSLAWVTVLPDGAILSCSILPGSLATRLKNVGVINPAGNELREVTDLVTLAAGEYTANLSEVVRDSTAVVARLSDGLGNWIRQNNLEGKHMPSDLMFAVRLEPDQSAFNAQQPNER